MRLDLLRQIDIHFQPIVDVGSGAIVRYEALSRFPQAVSQNVQSSINNLEELGMATELDRRVLSSIRTWFEANELPSNSLMSVNITGDSASNPDFGLWLEDYFETLRDPSLLAIEITETRPITHFRNAQNMIDMINSKGGRVYLDDYGTGHIDEHVLSQLSRISGIKLDGSFVNEWQTSLMAKAFAGRSIMLAQQAGIDVTAEFVDTPEDLEFAKNLGLDSIQGFLLGKPQATPECPSIVKGRWAQASEQSTLHRKKHQELAFG